MRKLSVASLVLAVGVAGCNSAPPKPVTPDGSNRVPVNDPQRVSNFESNSAEVRAVVAENQALKGQIQAMRQQFDEFRNAVRVLLAPQAGSGTPGAVLPGYPAIVPPGGSMPPPVITPPSTPLPKLNKQEYGVNPVAEAGGIPLIYRVYFGVGSTTFTPNPEQAHDIVEAAKLAPVVVVSGATDSSGSLALNQRLAIGRAQHARSFLIKSGVDAERIRTFYFAASRYAADNRTAEGRAQNRRVEIELRSTPPTAEALRGLHEYNS